MIENILTKVYLEGIEIPTSNITISNGPFCTATIELAFVDSICLRLKPGTLVHIFIYFKDKWRIFFVGKLIGTLATSFLTNIKAVSLFSTELSNAKISPINLQSSVYGHAIPMLNVIASDKAYHQKDNTEVLLFDSNTVEFFNFQFLEETGNVPDYIQRILNAASFISPWYRIMADTLNLNKGYYVLDNPNIFPITHRLEVSKLVNNALQNIGTDISYKAIIDLLLNQLRYKRYELNTPIKIDGEWKWIFLIPDTENIEPINKSYFVRSNTTSIDIEESMEVPTRVMLQPSSIDTTLNMLLDVGVKFLFAAGASAPYEIDGDTYRMKFTDEEKYTGVYPKIIPLDDTQLIYMMLDWKGNDISKLRNDPISETKDKLPTEYVDYVSQIAQYNFIKAKNSMITGTHLVKVYEPDLFPIFPIRLKLFEDFSFDVTIRSINYSFDAQGHVDISIIPKSATYSELDKVHLNWEPKEYGEGLKDFYKLFENWEFMTEEEYWASVGLAKGKTWRKSSSLDANVIAQLPMTENLLTMHLFTPLVKERAIPVAEYYKKIYNREVDLKEPAGVTNFVSMSNEYGNIETEGRDKNSSTFKTDYKYTKDSPVPDKFRKVSTTFIREKMNVIMGLEDAKRFLQTHSNVAYNNIHEIDRVIAALQTDEQFRVNFDAWVNKESSWRINIYSAINNKGYRNYGMYQLWGGHDPDKLSIFKETDGAVIPSDFSYKPDKFDVRVQTKYMSVLSKNFTVEKITQYGIAVRNNTYIGWAL